MATTAKAQPLDPENTLLLELKDGVVTIQLRPDLAPGHVARIKELARQKFYDGIIFHRVIPDFMAQTGDPTGTGTGGSGQKLKDELGNSAKHIRGTVSMAHAGPNTGDSQFFICYAPASHLDGVHTIWGQVVQGMKLVDNVKKGDKIISMRVAADVAAEKTAAPAAAAQ